MYQLYYDPNNASLAPHFVPHHIQAKYQLIFVDKSVNFQKSNDYLKLNPAGRIPTLIDNGQAIFESPAICIHLAEQYPEFHLIPPLGDQSRPLFFQWLAYLNNTLQAELMIRYYPEKHTIDLSTTDSIIAAQDERIAEALSVINDQLTDRNYLLGDKLTACDYFLFMLSEWSLPAKKSLLDFPYLAAYLNRMCKNPRIKAVCALEEIDLTPFR
ncbi:MAG: glutathione S-transferase [Kangiellaceae bacterium]|jgi:glutathione S-transferase|nr:glutathione S-transferase [Kangiellaceae bacterium]